MKDIFFITGATGNVGGAAARDLIAQGYEVRSVTRTQENVSRMPTGVKAFVGDLAQPESLAHMFKGVTALFLVSSIGNTREVLQIARKAGVRHVVLLSGGIAATSNRSNPIAAMFMDEEAAASDSGMDWTILRPGAFMTNVLGWANQLKHGDTVRAPFSHLKQAMLDPADIGSVAAVIMVNHREYIGKTYELTGSEQLTNADRAHVMAEVLERPIVYEPVTAEQARVAMSKTMPEAHVKAFFDFHGDGNVYEPAVSSVVETILGRKPRSFREWLIDNKKAFAKEQ
jgi:uncharacterized protein YbjT (DUF2867 family)